MFVTHGSTNVNDATVQNCFNTIDDNGGSGAIFKLLRYGRSGKN